MKLTRLHCPLIVGLMSAILVACAPLPHQPRTTMQIDQVISPNFDQRRPNLVIIHHTSDDTFDEALSTLSTPERKVSAHYLIGRDGRIVQLVNENDRAWHAGKSWWGGFTDINSASLGIELDNNGNEPFPEAQIDALLALLGDIRQRYAIPAANFIGHADVAPTRKDDPSILFPWQRLAENGFGLWCDAPLPPAPAGFDLAIALTALGYDPTTVEASLNAFRLHYTRGDQTFSSEQDNALAYCLWRKKSSPSQ
ncbi:N-acetylmuramoyl-L-alanine amidase [Propionivibrio sp.]|uniref:N-acetylmuramoyl-L-alanine amidase n=1 Tax=Propionivibrio sp. TaxID=2212460 RepID=UPI0025DE6CA6|nr:N-acetylmuramoyl-L-alanine amidase [Propionivibrio sp.]